MTTTSRVLSLMLKLLLMVQIASPGTVSAQAKDSSALPWPTQGWANATPASVGLDEKALSAFDAELGSGKDGLVDTFGVYRCGKSVFARTYAHDYAQIYAKEAKQRGPLNAHLSGWYNYFSPAWHPYFAGSDLHSMQSVSKTVTSIIVGIAATRGDFKANLDTPLLKYFDEATVKNMDERKRHITLRHVLTMSTGLDWNEQTAYDDPKNDASIMEATDDWVQYVIDRPMKEEPGKVFNYSSGVSELLAYIFQKETGQDIERYGQKYLFTPLGVDHFWKRSPLGLVDTEGGLFLNNPDLAKIGYLYLHDGMWEGQQIVSKDWVKQSVAPFIDAEEGYKYGFKWWLLPQPGGGYIWMARGFGGQRLMVFPDKDLVVVFTGWTILAEPPSDQAFVSRILPALQTQKCGGGN
jgi:CubicO group peptidase (beta-lactamase class C family)